MKTGTADAGIRLKPYSRTAGMDSAPTSPGFHPRQSSPIPPVEGLYAPFPVRTARAGMTRFRRTSIDGAERGGSG